jgi:hypothetical protein
MPTEYLSDKIRVVKSLILQYSLEMYQHELLVEDAKETAGDSAVDDQLAAQAETSRAIVLSMARRLAVRRAELAKLEAEQE